jgi:hypothetical protein
MNEKWKVFLDLYQTDQLWHIANEECTGAICEAESEIQGLPIDYNPSATRPMCQACLKIKKQQPAASETKSSVEDRGMSDFKLGDKVRVKETALSEHAAGEIGSVFEIGGRLSNDDAYAYYVEFADFMVEGYDEGDLELAQPDASAPVPLGGLTTNERRLKDMGVGGYVTHDEQMSLFDTIVALRERLQAAEAALRTIASEPTAKPVDGKRLDEVYESGQSELAAKLFVRSGRNDMAEIARTYFANTASTGDGNGEG